MESLEFSEQYQQKAQGKAHVLAFTSGKGGVGKTCITANVASALVRRGAKICIFDADTGLANINILLGLRPQFTLQHVLSGEKNVRDIVIPSNEGIAVVPGASGIAECANLGGEQAARLVEALLTLEAEYDFILIDTGAGVADSVLQFVESAPCAFLVITDEPTSLTDAFSLLKLLSRRQYSGLLRVIVNHAADYLGALKTYRRFSSAVEKYLDVKVEYGGFVARDDNVPRSVSLQMPVVELVANSPASRCLFALADNVLKYIGGQEAESGLSDYWRNQFDEKRAVAMETQAEAETPAIKEQPQEIAGTALLAAISATDLAQKMLAVVKVQSLEKEHLDDFIIQFVTAFVDQHGGFPQSFKQLFYRWLEAENYAAPRLMELVTTLEALYAVRYQQPLFSLEDSAARLVAQTQGAENRLRDLVGQLRAAYRQSYHAEVFDAQKEMLDIIQQEDFTEERFEDMLQALKEGFKARFNKPYQGQSELLLESTAEALNAMAVHEKELQEEVALMAQSFQQLTSRRDILLAAIKSAHNHDLTLKPRTSVNGFVGEE